MIWVLLLRDGDDNPEARYAIRSWVQNAGFSDDDTLVTVGYCPTWLRPDLHIPGNEHRSGPANVYANVLLACRHRSIHGEDQVIVTNDDMFAVEPTDPTVVYYRRPLAEHIRLLPGQASWWASSLRLTHAYLRKQGIEAPLSYELHRPLPVNPRAMEQILTDAHTGGIPKQFRSLYGNLHGIGGEQANDVKFLARRGEFAGPWASTTDGAWRVGWGERISALFPTSSRFERVQSDEPANERTTP